MKASPNSSLRVLITLVAASAVGRPQVSQSLEQSATREFDVVSVKPMQQKTEGFSMRFRVDPTMIDVTAQPLRTYVLQAYGLKRYQLIINGPAWIESDRYDIMARTTEPASRAEMMLMLRNALAGHFRLRVHAATREMTVYFLTVDRRGAKLKPATETSGPNIMVLDKNQVTASHEGMADFAGILSNFVTDRPVLDRTGLTHEFQFKLEFAANDDDPAPGPSIYTALTEQLGLRLVAGKAPVEVLVVDSAERPSTN
ncbi:MAG TPA: TIGR03435 family protein [Bryobacteraceae bacterium]|nr:TIGR03435 family protein [Bryobacteraceae bacterium]